MRKTMLVCSSPDQSEWLQSAQMKTIILVFGRNKSLFVIALSDGDFINH